MKVLINSGQGFQDYTRYVADGSLSVEDSINVPTITNFILTPTDNSFVPPPRSSYVQVVSGTYQQGTYAPGGVSQSYQSGGGYGTGKLLATGFVTNLPSVEYLGLSPKMISYGEQQLSYKVNVTSDEWLLNSRVVPYIPAFINRTQGEILASIAQTLAPGFFDVTTYVMSGDIVPYFQYSPDQTWSDIAKTFGDSSRYRYKVVNKTIYFVPFGDEPLGISYDERSPKPQWFPLELQTTVVTVPPVNDCLVIGQTEPQQNWENYFIGDGFSSQFRLRHQVFDGTTTLLLQDDWTEDSFQTQLWTVYDNFNLFSLDNGQGQPIGALNVNTPQGTFLPLGTSGGDYILSQNGVELGGGLNLQHGQVEFTNACSGGLIGGLYEDTSLTMPSCLAGFVVKSQDQSQAFTITTVITASGTNTVQMYATTNVTLQAGNVVICEGLSTASIPDNTRLQILSVSGSYVTLLSLSYFATTQTVTGLSGTIQALQGDVLVSASGAAGIVFQPVFNGQIVGPQLISECNHQYVLQTWIGAERWDRYERIYRNIATTSSYGGNNLAASGTISWVVEDYDQGLYATTPQYLQQTIKPLETKYTRQAEALPEFAIYAPINVQNMNLTLNYTAIYEPPQGTLFVKSLTGASNILLNYPNTIFNPSLNPVIAPSGQAFGGGTVQFALPVLPQNIGPEVHYLVGFGMAQQTATIIANGDTNYLAFYDNTVPGVGARIRYQSWATGEAMSRVIDSVAVSNEAKVSGDSGVRSAIMTNLTPSPRTSSECELAAAAAIRDREYPQFQGTYTVETVPRKFESLFNPGIYDYPIPGRYLSVYSPNRGIVQVGASGLAQNLFVNTTRMQVTELREEVLQLSIDYGPDLYLEKLLQAFTQRTDKLLTPQETAIPPNPIQIAQVGAYYLATPDSAQVVTIQNSSVTGNTIVIDLMNFQQTAGASGVEIRRIDLGWGNQDKNQLIGVFTNRYVTLPRTSRDQTWFLRYKNGNQYSRFSKALRVVYPLIPSAPLLVAATSAQATFDFNGDIRDIYGLELRATPASGILFFIGTPTEPDSLTQYVRNPVPISPAVQSNVIAVYNPPSNSATFPYATQLKVGDLIFTACPNDGSFQGIELVTQTITSTAAIPPVYPTAFTVNTFGQSGALFLEYHNPQTGFGYVNSQFGNPGALLATYNKPQSLLFNSQQGFSGDPTIQPMQEDVYDSNGIFHGRVTPWSLANNIYAMYAYGTLFCPTSGNHTIAINHDDGVLFAIPGATFVSGLTYDRSQVDYGFTHTKTVAKGYQFSGATKLAMNNRGGHYSDSWVISFPTSGFYNFELDYGQGSGPQTMQVMVDGKNVFPTPANIGQGGGPGTPWEFGWFDYGEPTPDVIGVYQFGVDNEVGTEQQIQTGNFTVVASGAISGSNTGLCSILTKTAHGFTVGENIIMGCGWGTWPNNLPTPPQTGAVFCGQQIVSNVLSTTGFQFVIPRFTTGLNVTLWEQQIAASGVNYQTIQGVCAPMPTALNTNNSTLASGVVLQRPVFSPADLIVDFTQPEIAELLDILQALSPNGFISGLDAYFFNLTWDYSAPTPIAAFVVPQIFNIVIDSVTQQVQWQVQGGHPSGYRIEVADPSSGVVYNKFTIDHASNPQKLIQFKLNPLDFASTRDIFITPFGGIGDGPSYVITNVNVNSITGGQTPGSYTIGCTYNGLLPPSTAVVRIPFDIPVQFITDFVPSQAYLENPSTGTLILPIYQIQLEGAPATQVLIGTITFSAGSYAGVFASTFGGTTIDFHSGDVVRIATPVTADVTAANLGLTLSGIKN